MGDKLSTVEENNKALWQFESAIHDMLSTLYSFYGLDAYDKEGAVTREIEKVALQLHARLMGVPDVIIGQNEELVSIPLSEEPDD